MGVSRGGAGHYDPDDKPPFKDGKPCDWHQAGASIWILDGTLLPIDRIAADWPFHFGKHTKYGMNVQVLCAPLRPAPAGHAGLPGALHDVRAAREHGIVDPLAEIGVTCWADSTVVPVLPTGACCPVHTMRRQQAQHDRRASRA